MLATLTMAYIRRKQFEGQASLAAMGKAIRNGQYQRVSPEAMLAIMGGGF